MVKYLALISNPPMTPHTAVELSREETPVLSYESCSKEYMDNQHPPILQTAATLRLVGRESLSENNKWQIVEVLTPEIKNSLHPGLEIDGIKLFSYDPSKFKCLPGVLARYEAHGVQDIKELAYEGKNFTVVIAVNSKNEIIGTLAMNGFGGQDENTIPEGLALLDSEKKDDEQIPLERRVELLHDAMDAKDEQSHKVEKPFTFKNTLEWTRFAIELNKDKRENKQVPDIFTLLLIESTRLIQEYNSSPAGLETPIKATYCMLKPSLYALLHTIVPSLIHVDGLRHSPEKVRELRRSYPLYFLKNDTLANHFDHYSNNGDTLIKKIRELIRESEDNLINNSFDMAVNPGVLEIRSILDTLTPEEKGEFIELLSDEEFVGWEKFLDKIEDENGLACINPVIAAKHRLVQYLMNERSGIISNKVIDNLPQKPGYHATSFPDIIKDLNNRKRYKYDDIIPLFPSKKEEAA